MELKNARITIMVGQEETQIELHDRDAGIEFVRIRLTPEQLSAALSRLAYVECKMEVHSLDRVGKIQEVKGLEFPISKSVWQDGAREEAVANAQAYADEGWKADTYFGSRDSFSTKGNVTYAKTHQRRWVEAAKPPLSEAKGPDLPPSSQPAPGDVGEAGEAA